MNRCICCHNTLLRHIRHRDIYWYCPSCHQTMPSLEGVLIGDDLPAPENVLAHRQIGLVSV